MSRFLATAVAVATVGYAASGHALEGVRERSSWSLVRQSGLPSGSDRRLQLADRHYQIARVLLDGGDRGSAIAHLRFSVTLNPEHIEALKLLGTLYRQIRAFGWDPGIAEHYLSRVIELRADDAEAWLARGQLRLQAGRFADAEQDARSALELRPADADAAQLLANALMRQRRYDEAADLYADLATAAPSETRLRWLVQLARGGPGVQPPPPPGAATTDADAVVLPYPATETATSPVRFLDVGEMLGVDRIGHGRGAAWADFDGDGRHDLLATGIEEPHSLYLAGPGGSFADATERAGLLDPRGGWAALAADFDNDGDPDIYTTRDGWTGSAPNSLYLNDGSGRFVDVAASAGVAGRGDSFTAAAADYDGDGLLDIYVANGISASTGAANDLYRNLGNGRFEEVAEAAGVAGAESSVGTAWGDYNGDGLVDLYVANFGHPNRLYRNLGNGRFADVTEESGTTGPRNSYMAVFFDYDGDALLDLFVGSYTSDASVVVRSALEGRAIDEDSRPALFRNGGDGRFTDVTEQAGLSRNTGTMAVTVIDIDYDGYQGLLLATGGSEMDRYEPDVMYFNRGDGTFVDVSGTSGLGMVSKMHGAVPHDFDADGDLDLYAAVGGQFAGDLWPNRLFLNPGVGNHWLTVVLEGTSSNRDAVGATVRIRSGDLQALQQVAVGVGFGSTPSLPLEFGLGDRRQVDEIEVRWPGGATQVVRDVPADRVIRITEGTEGYAEGPS